VFKVNARTVLELGSELISSDIIAFYELIKNAFDAKSELVPMSISGSSYAAIRICRSENALRRPPKRAFRRPSVRSSSPS